MRLSKITVINTEAPDEATTNEKIQWIAGSLGLFTQRDKDKSCFRVFVELLKEAKLSQGIASDELAHRLNLTRGTVIYHLNRLEEAGLIVSSHNKYYLSKNNLSLVLEELESEIVRVINKIKKLGEEVDKNLELES